MPKKQRCAPPVVGFQRRKLQACGDGFILYFLSELVMAPHLADAPLGWSVRGARGSKDTEEETSGVSEVLEAGPAPTTELAMEESVVQTEG
ncbi:hypothetical protein GW17_00024242 [Ensete ventricosum]|nr:hypothetical protein GW17_00024242 [Ensete ventricosum]